VAKRETKGEDQGKGSKFRPFRARGAKPYKWQMKLYS